MTTDGPLTYTTVQIDHQIRRVVDDYRAAPEFLRQLQIDFLTLANRNRSLGPPSQVPIPGPGTSASAVRRMFANRDINASDSNGWTPLMYATQVRWTPKAVKLLLDAGANPNSRSAIGDTVLMVAVTAERPSDDSVRWLIAAGANVNAQDREGRTALILAVQRFALPEGGASEATISLLLAAGARADIRDGHGMTALDYVEQDAKRAPKYPEKKYESLKRILAGN